MSVLLEAKNICKSFPGVRALNDVSFQLESGSVHALMGENGAGKSTLVKCFMGIHTHDQGTLNVLGREYKFYHPRQAIDAGIAMIEQELTPVDEMTVAENIFLGREDIRNGIFLDYDKMNRKASDMMNRLDLDIDVTMKMNELSLAEIQMVEIAKALSYNSEIIIMDEPTSAIGEKEVENLFRIIRLLKEEGKGIIYVSHRMEEIFTITDKITILRDGEYIDTVITPETQRSEVIEKMVGRRVDEEYKTTNIPQNDLMLQAVGFSQNKVLEDINMDLKKGEILGIFGLMGAGRSEFCDLLFGVTPKDSGKLFIEGKQVTIKKPKDAMKYGIAYVTEDRKNSGLYMKGNVKDNISLASLKEMSFMGFINEKIEKVKADKMVNLFKVKASGLDHLVVNLSGGNQQKVVLGKWVARDPKILILDEPTRGIDVGAKREIYEFMTRYVNEGYSIILISSEIPEILKMSNRIIIFKDGKIQKELSRSEADQNNVMHYASVTQ